MTPLDDFRNTVIAFMVLTTPAVAVRVCFRASRRLFSYDDGFLVVAYTTFMTWCIMSLVSLYTGLGSDSASPAAEVEALKLFVIATFLNFFAMYFAKISLALVLFRIAAPGSVTRQIILGSIAVLSAWFAVVVILYGIQCDPFPAIWGEPGTCRPANWTAVAGLVMSAMDIVFTFLYAFLPVYMLWNVQISLRTKLGIYFLLGGNIVTCIVTIIRLKYCVQMMQLQADVGSETLMIEANGSTYTTIDIGLTIVLTSLAALKGLLRLLPFFGRENNAAASGGKQTGGITYEMAPRGTAIRLDDRGDAESQEDMILSPSYHRGIKMKVDYMVEFSKEDSEALKKQHVQGGY